MIHWSNAYITVPFVDGGRDTNGWDCWGLVRHVLHEQCGIDVPSYGAISAADLAKIALEIATATETVEWIQVAEPREYDVCVMRWFARKGVGHVGVMLDGRRVLHTEENTGTMIVDTDHFSIKRRVVAFYRHKALA